MKRSYFFLVAALLQVVLFSCTRENDLDTPERVPGVVSFSIGSVSSAQQGDASRTAVLDLNGLKASGFYVNAYSTGEDNWENAKTTAKPEFMYKQLVEWKTSPDRWEYSDVKYWPGKVNGSNQYGKVSFFAWSKDAESIASVSGNTETGAPTLTVTVPDAQNNQKDLVTGVAVNRAADVNSGAVKFEFKHVLSRIGFTAKLDKEYPNMTVTIKSLKVKYKTGAVKSKGVYTFGETDPWALDGSTYMDNTAGDEVVDAGGGVELDNTASLTTTRVNGDDNYLMLLPQTVGKGDVVLDLETNGAVVTNRPTIELPAQTWELGKCYDYELVVSLNEVTFGDMSVEDWGTPTTLTLCELTYDANNGTGEKIRETLFTGRDYPLIGKPDGFTAPTDYPVFYGWNTKADGTGIDYEQGENVTLSGDIRLYARWVKL